MTDDHLLINTDREIAEGKKLLALDRITYEEFVPRNQFVLVRRRGKFEDGRYGNIVMPAGSSMFDIVEILAVGRGRPGMDGSLCPDTTDLRPGMLALTATKRQDPKGRQIDTGLRITVGGVQTELLVQEDIFVILAVKETNDGA